MTTLRQRKGSKGKEPSPAAELQSQQHNCCSEHHPEKILHGDWSWGAIIWTSVGWSVSVGLGLLCCIYVATLHENDLWFSNIKEVEREISFRTECGLYYSYYKQMLHAPSIQEGLKELIHDNLTESKRTINLLQRMNIYQEVFLSVLYRLLPIQSYLEPVYFYIYTVFSLQAVYVIALYLTAWLLSGSWLAGALTGVWYILNRVDTTRVEFTISLRENWSLPFLALQVTAITCYLRPQLTTLQQVMVWLMYVTTFCFCLTWQFNQFILLVQALVIYTLDCGDFLTTTQVTTLYLVQVSSLLSVWFLQFCNSMILGSLVWCSLSSLAHLLIHFLSIFLFFFFSSYAHYLVICPLFHNTLRPSYPPLQLRSDEHIFKFTKSKFALGPTRDFDASLYLCEEAFGLLPLDTLERLASTLLLYPYVLTLLLLCGMLVMTQQEHCLILLLLLFLPRMKYIWTGHMCAVAAYGVCGTELWTVLLSLRLVRYVVPVVMIGFLYYKFWPKLMEELSELREFYDPDTVELMTWISTKTPKQAVFAGSMQLLAGIKLCTGRVLTNHPHYEDKDLRERTRQVYQVYARRSPEEVYDILKAIGADYVVLENSICYERRHRRGCRLRDLLDLANGHIMDGPGENDPDLVPATHPRFCDAIKTDAAAYNALFTRTFQNKTFHVYRLKKKRKKNTKGSSEPSVTQ
uniref:Dpy-19 like C-mannosyltransferase 3 n=1 Tax=Oreochromis niloticus TaxID=8128 RepID=A0A669DYX0_ORENI